MIDREMLEDILALTPADRMLLVEEIWDSLADYPESVELTEAQRRILEARLESYRRDPDSGSTWTEVKQTISRVILERRG